MKKKLVITLFAAVIVLGFSTQDRTHADAQIPKITSIQPIGGTYVALNN
ncbi:hypothetical protein M9R32_14850 [Paenisporosarcina quisquiliarum]|uniref:Uncharacterized protein n=1 Tax=Paenisporosarcina quisquiliarum TaxID=365346 RepID=A0A9X3RFB0_9BACL|nr:hypothetical protein [Paenisporosarcina quisquiliarum]MCZ8538472.1 hypothetical protein [Paenisporosarcina quisquiliarum]